MLWRVQTETAKLLQQGGVEAGAEAAAEGEAEAAAEAGAMGVRMVGLMCGGAGVVSSGEAGGV